ncbi:MAG: molybdate ABC transporter substrate-binding protein [Gammaproteobacteria bacterium]
MPDSLDWPLEAARQNDPSNRWSHPGSNICLDFHGDPITAELVVFSDGNHHMALQTCLQEFRTQHPEVKDIFYATTPPGAVVSLLRHRHLVLGNLTLSRLPHVFISPLDIMQKLQADNFISSHRAFMQSQGNVLLIRKHNPKNIQGIPDLLRDEVRLFISSPTTEKASYEVYKATFLGLAKDQGIAGDAVESLLANTEGRVLFGSSIHHREAPQALYEGAADVAIVYYHLALRYSRIFADHFDFIPLGGSKDQPQPSPDNVTTTYYIGFVGDGGQWGRQFIDFMLSDTVTRLYREHGLRRA